MARKVVVSLRSTLKQARAVHLLAADLLVKAGGRHKRKLKVGVDISTYPAHATGCRRAGTIG
jgi:hypothetical protein